MNYIFMDNFRGFTQTIIPLRNTTFLVGENSTGKSSFLSLLYLLSTPNFWFNQDFSITDFCNLGGFMDIISAAGRNRSSFAVGILSTRHKKKNDKSEDIKQCKFCIMTFRNEEGLPRLARYLQFMGNNLLKIKFGIKSIKYKINDVTCPYGREEDLLRFFNDTVLSDIGDTTGFTRFSHEMPSIPSLPWVLGMIQSPQKLGRKGERIFYAPGFPIMTTHLTWLAPIRTKPRRTYDGFKTDFTPEGDHTPYVIRKTLGTRDKAKQFTKLLREFGDLSGLFLTVNAHSFGNVPSAPFEVQVQLTKHPLNISNVGYGVSQVLPVVVEILTCPDDHWFAIQQPEIHLHPKAQAALGKLMHYLATVRGHHYFIETHSDYLIDRFRLRIRESGKTAGAQVVFFERTGGGNNVYPLAINSKGQYPQKQPKNFRDFFINEEMKLLEI